MEVEIKLRLPSKEDYEKAIRCFEQRCPRPEAIQDKNQTNVFFDTEDEQLIQRSSILRLRILESLNAPKKYILTYKQRNSMIDGVMVSVELEDEIEERIALDAYGGNPNVLFDLKTHPGVERILQEHSSVVGHLESKGEFLNKRRAIPFSNEVEIEIDETHFPFGVSRELEVECNDPLKMKERMYAAITPLQSV